MSCAQTLWMVWCPSPMVASESVPCVSNLCAARDVEGVSGGVAVGCGAGSAPGVSRVVEVGSGAQILPPTADDRATVAGWHAYCVLSADLRAKSRAHAELAGRLIVETKESR